MVKIKTATDKSTAETTKPLSEQQILREFSKRDYFGDLTKCAIYEEITDLRTGDKQGLIHITNPYEEHGVVVSIPTQVSSEDVARIVDKISPVPEFCAMLAKMAECYELGKPLMIEGGTAVGKTFMVNKFTELLYGRGVKPLDFFCSGQTDVSDLIGKWVPREGGNTEVQQKWEKFLRSELGQSKLQQMGDDIAKTGDELSVEDKAKMYQARMELLATEAGLSIGSDFTFQLGAIPKAFTGEYRDGKFRVREGGDGFIVHVQEAGLAKPAVLNSLLRVRGEQGKIADELQLWEDSGRLIKRGPKTFIVFTNNPVDGYLDRKPIDPALSRGLEWLRFGEGLSEKSVEMTARKIFAYALGNNQDPTNRHSVFDFRAAPEVGEAIGLAMVGIHEMLAKHFNNPDQDDPQMMPVVMDNMFKVAEAMQNHQVKSGGQIDVGSTLMRAITSTYLERAKLEDREDLAETIKEKIFGMTSRQDFEGSLLSLAERLNVMAKRATKDSPVPNEDAAAKAVRQFITRTYFDDVARELNLRSPKVS
jgi:MoxR-like ATPase